jgi:hypothetical protein
MYRAPCMYGIRAGRLLYIRRVGQNRIYTPYMTAHQVISLSQIHIYIGYNIWLLANPIHTYGHIRCAFIAHAPDRLKNQGCCSTVYGTVYGNTVRYGKNVFCRIFENWHRIYGKIRYGERYGAKLALPVQIWPQNGLSAPKPPIFAPRCAPPMC